MLNIKLKLCISVHDCETCSPDWRCYNCLSLWELLNWRELSWRRQWHPTPVLLPGKSHGRRSLVGCSPWGRWESDTTQWLHFHFYALEKEMATHSSVLAWRIPGMAEPDGLPSMGSHRVRHDWSDLAAAAEANGVGEWDREAHLRAGIGPQESQNTEIASLQRSLLKAYQPVLSHTEAK